MLPFCNLSPVILMELNLGSGNVALGLKDWNDLNWD